MEKTGTKKTQVPSTKVQPETKKEKKGGEIEQVPGGLPKAAGKPSAVEVSPASRNVSTPRSNEVEQLSNMSEQERRNCLEVILDAIIQIIDKIANKITWEFALAFDPDVDQKLAAFRYLLTQGASDKNQLKRCILLMKGFLSKVADKAELAALANVADKQRRGEMGADFNKEVEIEKEKEKEIQKLLGGTSVVTKGEDYREARHKAVVESLMDPQVLNMFVNDLTVLKALDDSLGMLSQSLGVRGNSKLIAKIEDSRAEIQGAMESIPKPPSAAPSSAEGAAAGGGFVEWFMGLDQEFFDNFMEWFDVYHGDD